VQSTLLRNDQNTAENDEGDDLYPLLAPTEISLLQSNLLGMVSDGS